MKIVSDYKELEGKTFTSIRECAEAEAAIDKQRAESNKAMVSKKKKELADAVDVADKQVEKAYEQYNTVRVEVQKILEESNAKMQKMLNDAAQVVREAEQAKRDAIIKYTEQFGPYQKVYTGNRALQEFQRIEDQFNSTFANIVNQFLNL